MVESKEMRSYWFSWLQKNKQTLIDSFLMTYRNHNRQKASLKSQAQGTSLCRTSKRCKVYWSTGVQPRRRRRRQWWWGVSDFIILTMAYECGWLVLSIAISFSHRQCMANILFIAELTSWHRCTIFWKHLRVGGDLNRTVNQTNH